MENEKKGKAKEEKEKKEKVKKNQDIDKELDQSFPASDPPSYSRPANEEKASKVDKKSSSEE